MRFEITVLLLAGLAQPAAAEPGSGLPARAAPSDYAAQAHTTGASIGAALLTKRQLREDFLADLQGRYLVVEVGVYPAAGQRFDVRRDDFRLRPSDGDTVIEPADPASVDAPPARTPSSLSGVHGEVDLSVPIGGGGRGYGGPGSGDPRYGDPGYDDHGQRRGRGTRVSVGVGLPGPGSAEGSDDLVREEMIYKALPEKLIAKPAAGYLYFPVASQKKKTIYLLEYTSGGTTLVVDLGALKRK